MNKYKIEFIQKEVFVVDVEAPNEDLAKVIAKKKWNDIADAGIYHYYATGDPEVEIGTVYDVTNTDDPFDA